MKANCWLVLWFLWKPYAHQWCFFEFEKNPKERIRTGGDFQLDWTAWMFKVIFYFVPCQITIKPSFERPFFLFPSILCKSMTLLVSQPNSSDRDSDRTPLTWRLSVGTAFTQKVLWSQVCLMEELRNWILLTWITSIVSNDRSTYLAPVSEGVTYVVVGRLGSKTVFFRDLQTFFCLISKHILRCAFFFKTRPGGGQHFFFRIHFLMDPNWLGFCSVLFFSTLIQDKMGVLHILLTQEVSLIFKAGISKEPPKSHVWFIKRRWL